MPLLVEMPGAGNAAELSRPTLLSVLRFLGFGIAATQSLPMRWHLDVVSLMDNHRPFSVRKEIAGQRQINKGLVIDVVNDKSANLNCSESHPFGSLTLRERSMKQNSCCFVSVKNKCTSAKLSSMHRSKPRTWIIDSRNG